MRSSLNDEEGKDILGKLRYAIVLSVAIFSLEIVGGYVSNSLALLSDSGHVFLDLFALSLSYFAVRLSMKPANKNATYGLHRAEVLAALANGISLLIVAAFIFYFAYDRMLSPPPVRGSLMLTIAIIGLVGNLYVAYRIHGYKSLNVRSAYLHVLSDAFASLAVVSGGIAIMIADVFWIDPLLSFLIVILIVIGSLRVLVESVEILLEKVPRHIAPERLERELRSVKGVCNVHDLHVWSLCSNLHAISVHLVLDDERMRDSATVLEIVTTHLRNTHGIEHTTIQIEREPCGHEQ